MEFWIPLRAPFEGYAVSTEGLIKSLGARKRVRKTYLSPLGYHTLNLNKQHGTIFVHRLVLFGFVGPCPAGMEVRHLNGDATDNRLVNLQYGSSSQNKRDAWSYGRPSRGWILTPIKVRRIRRARERGVSVKRLAEIHAVAQSTIFNIINGNGREFD